jgi:hypothetical protein
MVDLSIIIVSYNTREFLRNCLKSILSSINGKLGYEVIVVDNASTDGTIQEIKNFLRSRISLRETNLKFVQNKKNIGFSKANNIGINSAKGRHILFLNPDTIVYPNTLETMVDFMDKHKDVGCATCLVKLPNGKIDDASHRGFPTPWNAFCYFSGLSTLFPKSKWFSGYGLTFMDLSTIHEIDAACGAFMLVRRIAGEKVGWWDEDYFFYGEDIDFCYELKQKKWKVYYVPTVSILHYKGVSGGIKKVSKDITTADIKTKILATRARFEAMKIFYKKHYLKKYPLIITLLARLGINIKLWFTEKLDFY